MLTVLAVSASTALAQSAGDNQYADPLVTDGGGDRSGQRSPTAPDAGAPPAAGGQAERDRPAEAVPEGTGAGVAPSAATPPSEATLPHTGAAPLPVGASGLALLTLGALGLASARRGRHARD